MAFCLKGNFMKVSTFNYCEKDSETLFSAEDFDSPRTSVIAFGATSFLENPEPLKNLAENASNRILFRRRNFA
jgi:hypothetical protein